LAALSRVLLLLTAATLALSAATLLTTTLTTLARLLVLLAALPALLAALSRVLLLTAATALSAATLLATTLTTLARLLVLLAALAWLALVRICHRYFLRCNWDYSRNVTTSVLTRFRLVLRIRQVASKEKRSARIFLTYVMRSNFPISFVRFHADRLSPKALRVDLQIRPWPSRSSG
jgi:hypothetical protein